MAAVNKRLLLLIAIRIIVKQRQRQRRRNQVTCRGRRKHKFWVRSIYKQRNVLGSHKILFETQRASDKENCFRYLMLLHILKKRKMCNTLRER